MKCVFSGPAGHLSLGGPHRTRPKRHQEVGGGNSSRCLPSPPTPVASWDIPYYQCLRRSSVNCNYGWLCKTHLHSQKWTSVALRAPPKGDSRKGDPLRGTSDGPELLVERPEVSPDPQGPEGRHGDWGQEVWKGLWLCRRHWALSNALGSLGPHMTSLLEQTCHDPWHNTKPLIW